MSQSQNRTKFTTRLYSLSEITWDNQPVVKCRPFNYHLAASFCQRFAQETLSIMSPKDQWWHLKIMLKCEYYLVEVQHSTVLVVQCEWVESAVRRRRYYRVVRKYHTTTFKNRPSRVIEYNVCHHPYYDHQIEVLNSDILGVYPQLSSVENRHGQMDFVAKNVSKSLKTRMR